MRRPQVPHHVSRLDDAERLAAPLVARGRHCPEVLAAGERGGAILGLDAIHRLAALRIDAEYLGRPSIRADDQVPDGEITHEAKARRSEDLAEHRLRAAT